MGGLVRLAVRFEGHVQGVGLRGTLSKYCARNHVTGRMQNAGDPTFVLAELQGERASVGRALRSVESHFRDPGRCRGMSVTIAGELPLVEGETLMREAAIGDAGVGDGWA